jgi:hypothetical protein
VRYGAGGNEETKLTRQSRNALSESNSNLYPISTGDERINPTTVRGHKLWRRMSESTLHASAG